MRNKTKFSPSVGTLESRELLSSIGTLNGTINATFMDNYVGFFNSGEILVYNLTSAQGTVKPFGRVSIVDSGGFSSSIREADADGIGVTGGSILLAKPGGRTVGQIFCSSATFHDATLSGFRFTLRKLQNGKPGSGPVVAHGTANISFPQGGAVFNVGAVPFTITL